jgi:hypothetical protein
VVDFALTLRKPVPAMEKLAGNLSASQFKTWKRCKRLWFFTRVAGVKERQQQAHVLGHATHSVLERYILGQAGSWEGLFPAGWDAGLDAHERSWVQDVTRRGIERGVIQAAPGSQVEVPIAFLTPPEHADARGLPLLAKAETYLDDTLTRRVAKLTTLYDGQPLPSGWDRLPPFVGFIDHLMLRENPPRVIDHKTAKNRRYATTEGKLAEDVQVLAYAALPLVLRPEVGVIRCLHNVFLKDDSADPYSVAVDVTLEKVQRTWADIRQAAADMQLVREVAPKVVDPSNPFVRANNWQRVKSAIEEGCAQESCNAFGGCAFKDACFGRATAEQVVRRLDSPDVMGLVRKPAPQGPPPPYLRSRPQTQTHPHPASGSPHALRYAQARSRHRSGRVRPRPRQRAHSIPRSHPPHVHGRR